MSNENAPRNTGGDSPKRVKNTPLLSRRDFALGAAVGACSLVDAAAAALDELPAEAKAIRLEKSAEVAALLKERLIVDDEVRRVIASAEQTGHKLYRPDSDRLLTKLRVGQVYFYVEYSPAGASTYKIHRAWEHRFLILKEPY